MFYSIDKLTLNPENNFWASLSCASSFPALGTLSLEWRQKNTPRFMTLCSRRAPRAAAAPPMCGQVESSQVSQERQSQGRWGNKWRILSETTTDDDGGESEDDICTLRRLRLEEAEYEIRTLEVGTGLIGYSDIVGTRYKCHCKLLSHYGLAFY